jgi:hypothetical protein
MMILSLALGLAAGCATTSRSVKSGHVSGGEKRTELRSEELSAIESVVSAISGQNLPDEKRREVIHNLRRDEEAQSAVLAIKDAVTGEGVVIKYCPRDGKRYHARFTMCPEHHIPLEIVADF